jgi:hypothetical protein
MIKVNTAATLAIALGASASFAQNNKVTRTVAVDDNFMDGSVTWNGATAGGYEARIGLTVNNGVFELCGVGAVTNIQLRSSVNSMLRGCKLNINGKVVLKNCSYFSKARSKNAVPKTPAICARTNMKAQKIDLIDFQYGDGTFRN